jgi:small subunit ribosomal protein S16
MLIIRLQRAGAKNKPTFRVVLAESYRSASKLVLEVLGQYNPKTKALQIKDENRVKKLLTQNTKMSPSVYNLFVEKKLVSGKKVKAWSPKKKAGSDADKATAAPAVQPTETPAA